MYINPFLSGVLATIVIEVIALIVIAFTFGTKK